MNCIQKSSLSVIIPTFNRASLLRRAVQSVQSQSLKPDEIIVVDDGSIDDTAIMIKHNFPTVKYYYQENKGISAARNAGINMASGEWIAFLDSDDEWLREKLAKQMSALSANPEMKICHTDEIWIRKGRRVNQKKKHAKFGGYIFKRCLPLCIISPSSVVIHRSIFEDMGLFDEVLPVCEDYDMWLRVCAKYPVLYINEPLIVKYGGHADQLSHKYWGMDRFRIKAVEKIVESGELGDADREAALKMLVRKTRILRGGAKKRKKEEFVEKLMVKEERYLRQLEVLKNPLPGGEVITVSNENTIRGSSLFSGSEH